MNKTFRIICILAFLSIIITSCSRSITVYEAANGKAKCGRSLR